MTSWQAHQRPKDAKMVFLLSMMQSFSDSGGQTPPGAGEVCALRRRLIPTWPPAPLNTAHESPGVRALGGSQSAVGVGPGPADVLRVSASPPPLPTLTGLRDDKLTPSSSSPGLGGTPGDSVRHCSAPEDPIFRFSSLHSYLFPGTIKSRDMSRKRHHLVPETFGVKRRRKRGLVESDPLRGEPGSARAAVSELMQLFPRGLFEDALPPIVLRSQVYSLVPDRTVADRQLKELQEQREIRIVQLGFDLDAHGIIFTEDYRTRVLKACDGRPYAGAVQKFLASVLPACGDLSFQQDQMTQTFGFRDSEITHLVNAGVLTVRDAGSWWLAVPGAGRFIKYFVKGRQAVLGMVRKAKYRELLLSELLGRRAPAVVRLGLTYHVHDLIGAQLVDCISTTSGTLLRLPET
ncbi:PREDICTED: serine/threonine-protein kinase 19 isoform X2 [Rhinopithecus bieti]|nr:PREDICTED: serine/threonine-protein kinase 19 isoform X2 [Rhinopithecus bieti]